MVSPELRKSAKPGIRDKQVIIQPQFSEIVKIQGTVHGNGFQADTVKMDMCFFDSGFPEDHKQYLLVTDSMKLLKDLHMEIVTEGIETAPQVDALAGMGVDLIQGYYYAKPLSPDDFDAFWAQHRALS